MSEKKKVSKIRNIISGVILVIVLIAATIVWIKRGHRLTGNSLDVEVNKSGATP